VVLRHEVTIPDLASDLAVSSIFVLDRTEIDPRNRRLDFEEQLDEPYVWWGTKLTPSFRTIFHRRDKLSVAFVIYNAARSADDKPDVEVRYDFHQKTEGGESFFVTTRPERFNASTLGSEFRVSAGHLIVAGQEIPLARFRDGVYRLAITVADHAARKSLTRDVIFNVAGA
jgi:hypothetical protein